MSMLGKVLGGKKASYNAPDLSYLKDYSGFKYLRDYDAPGYLSGDAEGLFKDYLTSITGPEAYGAETDYMNQLLKDIDTSTGQALGSQKLDYLDRGLGGPGQMSDIEAVALAQTRGEGERQKNIARTDLMRGREEALRGAYGTRYGVGATADESARGREFEASNLYAQLLNQRDLARATGQLQSAAQAAQYSGSSNFFGDLLKGFATGAVGSAGQSFGKIGGTRAGYGTFY